jgi:hypothetical protein
LFQLSFGQLPNTALEYPEQNRRGEKGYKLELDNAHYNFTCSCKIEMADPMTEISEYYKDKRAVAHMFLLTGLKMSFVLDHLIFELTICFAQWPPRQFP